MRPTHTPGIVLRLRAELDKLGVPWELVRGYPEATFLPESTHTIWWGGPTLTAFRWGHHLEHEDRTVGEVIARLRGELDASEEGSAPLHAPARPGSVGDAQAGP